jgi:hypothetical protein
MEVLQQRQQRLLSLMPNYARRMIFWAILGFLVYLFLQLIARLFWLPLPPNLSQLSPQDIVASLFNELKKIFAVENLSLGSAISAVLSLFSNVVMWAFVLWSLTFVPFLAYNSYKLSHETKSDLTTRPLKWVQLFASTFLPMAAFAIAWNSITNRGSNIVVQIRSVEEAIILVVSTAIITIALFLINGGLPAGSTTNRFPLLSVFINGIVPIDAIAIRLSLLSALIYASLFLAYGQGYSVASFAALFGILFYLMFASGQIEEMGRKIVIYDLDPNVAQKLDVINAKFDQLRVTRDETALSQRETQVLQEQAKAKSKLVESQVEQRLSRQLSEIQSRKIELVEKVNQTQIDMLEQKIKMLSSMFDVASKEFETKLELEFPQKLDELREKAKTLSPQDLYARMDALMKDMNPILEGLPETLGELRTQLLNAANELETQTRLLMAGSTEKPEGSPFRKIG